METNDSITVSSENGRRRRKLVKRRTNYDKKYRRYEKPPYSYVGLIALAIQNSTTKMLKLSDILLRISTMFPFFKGEYQGWRDSVRHNLSQNKCFKKVLPDPSRPHSKGNYWTVDIGSIPPEKLKRQNTSVSRNVAPGFTYAKHLTDIFDLESGKLKSMVSKVDVCNFHDDQHSLADNLISTIHKDVTGNSAVESPCSINEEVVSEVYTLPHHIPSSSNILDEHGVVCWKSHSQKRVNDKRRVENIQADSSNHSNNRAATNGHFNEISHKPYETPYEQNKSHIVGSTGLDASNGLTLFSLVNSLKETDSLIAPNKKPFFKQPSSILPSMIHPTAKPILLSSTDQTVGPEGPPNITWTSSNALPIFYGYFPAPHDVNLIHNKGQDSSNTSRHHGPYRDQTEFLLDQASILANYSSNTNQISEQFNKSALPMDSLLQVPNQYTATRSDYLTLYR
ncbi:transcription factor protein [Ciona intestinalis]